MEKRLDRQEIYTGKVIHVTKDKVELDNGTTSYREGVYHNGGACIGLKDKDGKFFMVRQYRYVPGVELLEFPAGKIEINEDPDNTILRECIEETGYSCKNLRKLDYMIPTCGYSSEIIYLYYGEVDEKVGQHFDVDEDLKLEKYSIEEIKEMVKKGIISDGKTICLILKMKLEGII